MAGTKDEQKKKKASFSTINLVAFVFLPKTHSINFPWKTRGALLSTPLR